MRNSTQDAHDKCSVRTTLLLHCSRNKSVDTYDAVSARVLVFWP